MRRWRNGCDLLSKSVHCNVENNIRLWPSMNAVVVICFQNPFIAMSKTTDKNDQKEGYGL